MPGLALQGQCLEAWPPPALPKLHALYSLLGSWRPSSTFSPFQLCYHSGLLECPLLPCRSLFQCHSSEQPHKLGPSQWSLSQPPACCLRTSPHVIIGTHLQHVSPSLGSALCPRATSDLDAAHRPCDIVSTEHALAEWRSELWRAVPASGRLGQG